MGMFGSKEVAPTVDERLAELERKWPLIQQKISAYDALSSDIESLKSALKSFRGDLEAIKLKQSDITKLHGDLATANIKSAMNLESKIALVQPKIDELVQKNVEIAKSFSDYNETFTNRISTLSNEVVKRGQTYVQASELKSAMANVQASLDNAALVQKNHREDTDRMKSQLQPLLATQGDHANKINTLGQSSTKAVIMATETSMKVDTNFDRLKKYIQDAMDFLERKDVAKIEKLKESLEGTPASLQNLRDEFTKKLESIRLDSENAFLKSKNCAASLIVIEKKIENLALQMKSLELPK